MRTSVHDGTRQGKTGVERTLDGALARKVVLEQILALVALEQAEARTSQHTSHHLKHRYCLLTPTPGPPTCNAT